MTPNPPDGITRNKFRITRFERQRLDSRRVCPRRPHSGVNAIGSNQWITRFGGFWTYEASLTPRCGLLTGASVEPDEHVSVHPALRADHMTVGETVPLAPAGEAGFTGCGRGLRGVLRPPVARGIDREVSGGTLNENSSRSRASDSRPLQSQYRTGRNISSRSQNGCKSMTNRGSEVGNS